MVFLMHFDSCTKCFNLLFCTLAKGGDMYFGKYENDEELKGKPLPFEWLEEVTKTFNDAYEDKRTEQNRFFEVFGQVYEKEFAVIFSYLHATDPMSSPITLFISHDHLDDTKKFKQALSALVDFAGIIFDDITSVKDWSEYNSVWTVNEYKGFSFSYKLTRENISLSLQAEELLKEDSKLL